MTNPVTTWQTKWPHDKPREHITSDVTTWQRDKMIYHTTFTEISSRPFTMSKSLHEMLGISDRFVSVWSCASFPHSNAWALFISASCLNFDFDVEFRCRVPRSVNGAFHSIPHLLAFARSLAYRFSSFLFQKEKRGIVQQCERLAWPSVMIAQSSKRDHRHVRKFF